MSLDSTSASSLRTRMEVALPTPAGTPAQSPCKQETSPPSMVFADDDPFDFNTSDVAVLPYLNREMETLLESPPVQVTIGHGNKVLHDNLYHMPALFNKLHERFFDISPAEKPRIDDPGCKPWTLMHEIQGRTWVEEGCFSLAGVEIAQSHDVEPRFVAVTDRLWIWAYAQNFQAQSLGIITMAGAFESCEEITSTNDVIVGLPSTGAFLGTRAVRSIIPREMMHRPPDMPKLGTGYMRIRDYTPAPTSAAVLSLIRQIHSAADINNNITGSGVPKKRWVWENLHDHFDPAARKKYGPPHPSYVAPPPPPPPPNIDSPPVPQQSGSAPKNPTLSPSSPLWPHRGNEALLKRSVWVQMCYTSGQSDDNVESRGGVKIPDAYSQVLFEDLQGRRRVPGSSWQLAGWDAKWYAETGEVEVDALVASVEEGC